MGRHMMMIMLIIMPMMTMVMAIAMMMLTIIFTSRDSDSGGDSWSQRALERGYIYIKVQNKEEKQFRKYWIGGLAQTHFVCF